MAEHSAHGLRAVASRTSAIRAAAKRTAERALAGTVAQITVRAASHPAAAPIALLAAGGAGAAYLWGHNPHEPGSLFPRCPFNWATGLLCPACGGTRMAYDLLHGDVLAAFHDNAALLLVGLPSAAYLCGRWLWEGLRGRRYRLVLGRGATAAVLGTAVVWAVARNVLG